MEFRISRASKTEIENPEVKGAYKKGKNIWYIKINTIEELIDLQKSVDREIIIGDDYITIYDDFIE